MSRSALNDIDGVLLLDKPLGLSSNQALQKVKRLFSARKAGHTGSLDPLATGLLPLCFGRATRLSRFLLEADKEYHVVAKLGVQTTTGDAEGEVVSTRLVNVTDAQLQSALQNFQGVFEQIPSMYSALKHQGQPLYKLARQGITIPREARTVTVTKITATLGAEDTVVLQVACSKGTYVRTLVEDLGEKLGCGAHVTVLRRTSVAGFREPEMVALPTLMEALEAGGSLLDYILPASQAMGSLPAAHLSQDEFSTLREGKKVRLTVQQNAKWISFYHAQEWVGVGEVFDEGWVGACLWMR